jgi:hypothetical protein
MGSALAVAMAPIGTESRFAGWFGLACRIGFEIFIRTREFASRNTDVGAVGPRQLIIGIDFEGFAEKPHRPVCITM